MYTLTIKLKQHTPLIHFQHDQDGATLRASEVKPKLDKYIINRIGDSNYNTLPDEEYEAIIDEYEKNNTGIVFDSLSVEEQIFIVGLYVTKKNGWLLDYEHHALDYKIHITASEKDVWDFVQNKRDGNGGIVINNKTGKPYTENIPLFFGNMRKSEDEGNKPKKLVLCNGEDIYMDIFSFHSGLLKEIHEHYINEFLLTTNFGTRQSKGFGSFYPSNAKLSMNDLEDYFYFVVKPRGTDLWHRYRDLFTQIDFFYKALRSGINQGGFYFKSLMFHYALSEKGYYDKRRIRYFYKHFKPDSEEDKGEKFELREHRPWDDMWESKSRLYRDMLGLSTVQEWKYYNATITKENETISRFKSPITFKPLLLQDNSFVVLIIPSEVPQAMFNQKFTICSKGNNRGVFDGENEGKMFEMETPRKFDVVDFLQYSLSGKGKDIALKQLCNKRNVNSIITRVLIPIFEHMHCPSK